jgi:hypothetical protein
MLQYVVAEIQNIVRHDIDNGYVHSHSRMNLSFHHFGLLSTNPRENQDLRVSPYTVCRTILAYDIVAIP